MTSFQLNELVGREHAEALTNIGILTPSQLLESGASPSGRLKIADTTHLEVDLLKQYVCIADLLRVEGMTLDLARKLYDAGVMTTPRFAYRSPDGIVELLGKDSKTPKLKDVERMIDIAKSLPKVVLH